MSTCTGAGMGLNSRQKRIMLVRKRRPRQVLHGGGGPYDILRTLGRGSTAIVKLGVHMSSMEPVAVKMMTHKDLYEQKMAEQVRREIEALSKLNHPNVLRLYEVIENPIRMFIVTELADQDLFDYIVARGHLTEEKSRQFFQQLICGLIHCHRRGIAHRDIKPENLLISSDGRLLIADFGLSGIMREGELLKESCGSYNYAAPEVILSRPYKGPEVDIWSSGVVLYVMLTGKLPFDGENSKDVSRAICQGMYHLPQTLSRTARDILSNLIVVDPGVRYTQTEIRAHPFFRENLPRYLSYALEDEIKGFHIKGWQTRGGATTMDPNTTKELQARGIKQGIIERAIKMGPSLITLPAFGNRLQLRCAAVMYHLFLDRRRRTVIIDSKLVSPYQDYHDLDNTKKRIIRGDIASNALHAPPKAPVPGITGISKNYVGMLIVGAGRSADTEDKKGQSLGLNGANTANSNTNVHPNPRHILGPSALANPNFNPNPSPGERTQPSVDTTVSNPVKRAVAKATYAKPLTRKRKEEGGGEERQRARGFGPRPITAERGGDGVPLQQHLGVAQAVNTKTGTCRGSGDSREREQREGMQRHHESWTVGDNRVCPNTVLRRVCSELRRNGYIWRQKSMLSLCIRKSTSDIKDISAGNGNEHHFTARNTTAARLPSQTPTMEAHGHIERDNAHNHSLNHCSQSVSHAHVSKLQKVSLSRVGSRTRLSGSREKMDFCDEDCRAIVRVRRLKSRVILDMYRMCHDMYPLGKLCSSLALRMSIP